MKNMPVREFVLLFWNSLSIHGVIKLCSGTFQREDELIDVPTKCRCQDKENEWLDPKKRKFISVASWCRIKFSTKSV